METGIAASASVVVVLGTVLDVAITDERIFGKVIIKFAFLTDVVGKLQTNTDVLDAICGISG